MRPSLSAVSLLAILPLVACGDAVSNTGQRPPLGAPSVGTPRIERAASAAKPAEPLEAIADSASAVDVSAPASPMRTTPIGALEQPQALRHVYEALARLDDGQAHDDVRILQYGDSHTASDLPTGAVRRALQARFGDGGRGFVSIGTPWKHYRQAGVTTGMTPELEPEKGRSARGKPAGDGAYGLLGVAVAGRHAGRAWIEETGRSSRIELSYLEQPEGGSFDVFIDHAKVMRIGTTGAKAQSAWRVFDLPEAPHKIEVHTVGDGDVRLFGATLDRPAAGVQVDSLGINGAQIYTALSWNEAHFAEQLKHRAPDLVILAYGTNEALSDTTAEHYERRLVDLLGRIARATPSSSCLLLGPPDLARRSARDKEDWKTSAKLVSIVASQRRVAEAAGCGFYDQLKAMGGEGSIATWAKEHPPLAIRDRVHLTKDGYEKLAGMFVTDLLTAYGVWRSDNGLAPTPPPPAVATPPAPVADALPRHQRRVRPRAER